MKLRKVRIQNYRSIRDTGWFDIEKMKTILVGPNEAGKTVVLRALQNLNPADGDSDFEPLRDFPRSEYNRISRGEIDPAEVAVVSAKFDLDDKEVAEIPEEFVGCKYVCMRYLDNQFRHYIEGGPSTPKFLDIKANLQRLAHHVDRQSENNEHDSKPGAQLKSIIETWNDDTKVSGDRADALKNWLDNIFPMTDEDNKTEINRWNKLNQQINVYTLRKKTIGIIRSYMPIFVYFNNYFRVRPSIHLGPSRREQNRAYSTMNNMTTATSVF